MKAFELGADGVLIGGCHPGDCHYAEGNYKALRRVHLLKKMMRSFGIDEKRLRLEWISASEGDVYQHVATEFTQTIRSLGPLNWKQHVDQKSSSEQAVVV
jgi:F420-non-reducing hydrogenase iron-sulfur subunit